MFTNNILIILLLVCLNTLLQAQGNKEYFNKSSILYDEFDKNAWDRIKALKKEVEAITNANGNLQSEIYNLKNDLGRLQNVYRSLLISEKELNKIKGELQVLKSNYIALSGENQDLKSNIYELEERLRKALILINEYKEIIESQADEIVGVNSRAQALYALSEARNEVIEELINEEAKENEVSLYNIFLGLGAGSSFSGTGMYAGFKIGYDEAVGIKSSIGYLPDLYQTEGIYAGVGLDIYLNEHIYISSSYQKLVKHIFGIIYEDALTFTAGIDYTFRRHKGIGIKLGIGGIYLYTKEFESRSLISGDLGVFYKFKIGWRTKSI